MPAPKGRPKPSNSGRKKGTPNKNTKLLKDAILAASELAGIEVCGKKSGVDGSVEYLKFLAVNHPPAFAGLLGKVLPTQITGDPDNPVSIIHTITRKIVKDGKSR